MWLSINIGSCKKCQNQDWILCVFFFFSYFQCHVCLPWEWQNHTVVLWTWNFFFVFFSDRWICFFMKRHTQKQNYVRRSPGIMVRLYLWDLYRGLWRQTAKNILTVFWIRMAAAARNSIFFITEIKQRWMQLTTTITAILSSDWKAFSGGSRGRAWGGRPPYFGRKKKK